MNKEIKTLEDFVDTIESILDIPENHQLIPIFENNESNEIIGWVVAEIGVEADYPMYTSEELIEKFKKQNDQFNRF